MRDYLGKVSLTLDDIRKLSSSDQSHWLVLRETKTGSVELKIKVLSEECEVHITTFLFQKKSNISNCLFDIFSSSLKAHMQPAISAKVQPN